MKLIPLCSDDQTNGGFSHRVTLDRTDINATALTQTINLRPLAIGEMVGRVALLPTELFAAPSLSSLTISVGDTASNTQYTAASANLFSALTQLPSAQSTQKNYAAASQATIGITAVGANLNTLTAGKVTVLLEIINLNQLQ